MGSINSIVLASIFLIQGVWAEDNGHQSPEIKTLFGTVDRVEEMVKVLRTFDNLVIHSELHKVESAQLDQLSDIGFKMRQLLGSELGQVTDYRSKFGMSRFFGDESIMLDLLNGYNDEVVKIATNLHEEKSAEVTIEVINNLDQLSFNLQQAMLDIISFERHTLQNLGEKGIYPQLFVEQEASKIKDYVERYLKYSNQLSGHIRSTCQRVLRAPEHGYLKNPKSINYRSTIH